MKIFLFSLLLFSGCCYTHYSDSRIDVTRISTFTDSAATKISVTATTNSTTVKIGIVESEGAKATGEIIKHAAKAAL